MSGRSNIYRVHHRGGGDESKGYSFHPSRREAERAVQRPGADIEEWPLPRTKAEVLALLRGWAEHPNNG